MKVLFLDVDGVLVPHGPGHEHALISRDCVKKLNRILFATGAEIVISSSWKWYIINGYMNLWGFQFMLRTHGLTASAKVIGHVPSDDTWGRPASRQEKIAYWMRHHPEPIERFVILDDTPVQGFGGNFVRTRADTGLRRADVEQAIRILNRQGE